jgi:hypothetical protein
MIMDVVDVVMISYDFIEIRVISSHVGGSLKESGLMGA